VRAIVASIDARARAGPMRLEAGPSASEAARTRAHPRATPAHLRAAPARRWATGKTRTTWPERPDDDRREPVTLERVNTAPHSSSAGAGAPKASLPPRLLRGITAVRKRLPHATDFGELFECFDDRIARAPELWEHSHLREHEPLVAIAVAVARRYRPGFEPLRHRVFELGHTGFWHGAVAGNNALACLFFDEHVALGLVTVSNAFDGSSRTDFVRFGQVGLDCPSAARSRGRMPS
jgi:hypothetical protein